MTHPARAMPHPYYGCVNDFCKEEVSYSARMLYWYDAQADAGAPQGTKTGHTCEFCLEQIGAYPWDENGPVGETLFARIERMDAGALHARFTRAIEPFPAPVFSCANIACATERCCPPDKLIWFDGNLETEDRQFYWPAGYYCEDCLSYEETKPADMTDTLAAFIERMTGMELKEAIRRCERP